MTQGFFSAGLCPVFLFLFFLADHQKNGPQEGQKDCQE